ncbi:non-ribosomal peptide synthase domain protein/amino acid adenylation domain protein [Rubidibacter lacunae KORDI 51-2]|uniref:Non-ribosomal peptide synthase domain protein/amino acid adenylation domain protein n=1 Tax=Rubidibacter lacunae KORDI 51-2 TaxID=582515 RepID=U5DNA2_9CHRO|nr:non-ribosomal peptide synthetase [Rubidibacter lacunae]ERN42084.1 non-ribosomal peptide synthase domain protein/amino acid adenylation domain protein [Rubidibacter lacunae KORDI 51-2]
MDRNNSNRKSQLSAAKQALLAKRLRGKGASQRPTIPQRDPKTPVPLSFSQQRLWFLNQFEPNSPFYNVPFALHLRGQLNVSLLERAFQALVRRHEILRTTIDNASGEPQQIIHDRGAVTLEKIDLSSASNDVLWSKVKHIAREEAGRPFDLHSGPFLRVTLLTLAADEFVLLVTLHHIISDVWSTTILIQEVATLYHAFSQGKPDPLPTLPIQYADYTLWQRQMLQGDRLQTQLDYWQQQFATPPPLLQLPTDRPRPAVQTFNGSTQTFILPPELTAALKTLGQEANATPFMVLLAGFKLLLSRYSGQADITVGSPIANRNQAAIEGLMGLFLNTLALRTDLSGNPTFRDLLARVREVALGGYSHQDLPFDKLVEVLQLPRNLSHTPLFQVMFILQNPPVRHFELSGLSFEALDLLGATAKFDLTLTMMEKEDCLEGILEYNVDLFDPPTIERLIGNFQTLLDTVVAAPDTPIHGFSLLTSPEWQQIEAWNQNPGQFAIDGCLHHLIEAQVARTPEAVAVTYGADSLTYYELNQRADLLAKCLRGIGVGPERLVGICLERSLEMVTALLAVLKAGGAYVPLDPGYPQQRLAYMVEDAKIDVLLSQSQLSHLLPDYQGQRLYLDEPLPEPVAVDEKAPSTLRPENLAYVIYTSGSTGQPKGVQITHRGVVNSLQAQSERLGLTQDDCLLAVASICFDISVLDLFLPLIVGARIVVASREMALDGRLLAEQLDTQQITYLQATPATWRLLLLADWSGKPDLTVLCGAEALPPDLADALLARCATLWDLYGPTETTIWSTEQQISTSDDIAVGTQLSNIQLYLLDEYLNPVPVGVPGEAYIGGPGLSRGYRRSPGLTAERFIPHPFSQIPGDRLYRTGDLARFRPDGSIKVLGRLDNQVKIRGFRIELGEIESVLSRHERVRAVVAMVREDSPGQKRLVAYLTAQSTSPEQSQVTVSELRQWLQTQLPDYMIPAAFVWLERMPLTPSGKVNRRELPAPDTGATLSDKPFEAPHSAAEKKLATIWSQLLGIESVGIDDNFFELGGDSILSLQMVLRATQADLHLTPKQLFQHQTIRALAQVAVTVTSIQAEQGAVTGESPLLPIQHWFFDRNLPEQNHWSQAVLLQAAAPLTFDRIRQIAEKLLEQHDVLRSHFTQTTSTWTQTFVGPLENIPCQEYDLTQLPAEEQTAALAATIGQLRASLDLTAGPLLHFALFQTATGSHLAIVVHRLEIDSGSWQILLEDLQALLQERDLPAKTCSYRQWSDRLQSYDAGPQREFWLEQGTVVTALPTDFLKAARPDSERDHLTLQFSVADTAIVLQQVPSAYRIQVPELLLTALTRTIAQWSENPQVYIDIVGDGRVDLGLDLSHTIGCFDTRYPLQFDLTGINGCDASLKAIREQLHQVPDRGLGYGVLRFFAADKDLAAKTPAPIQFNYLAPFELDAEGLSLIDSEAIGLLPETTDLATHQLAIDAEVVAGQLSIRFGYCQAQYQRETIEQLAAEFERDVRSLIAHCLRPETHGYTPADFPLATLKQPQLDRLITANGTAISDLYRLSPTQEGLLFHGLYSADRGLYTTQFSYTLEGDLDIPALQQAWQTAIARHPSLRTAFVWEGLDEPLQYVMPQVELPWTTVDLSELSADSLEERLQAIRFEERARGYALERAPLMRLTLIRLQTNLYELIWSFHHLILDGWSLAQVLKMVSQDYVALAAGSAGSIPAPRPYRDYIEWLTHQDRSEALAYWQQYLARFARPTSMPTRSTAAPATGSRAEQKHGYACLERTLSADTATALQNLTGRSRLTLNTLVQGAWSLLLSHVTGEVDLVFGATGSGRPPNLSGAEEMVGVFINTLPVRIRIDPEQTLSAWLQHLQEQQITSRQYDFSSLAQIQRVSNIPQGTPLFENLIVFENFPIDTKALNTLNTNLKLRDFQATPNNNYPLTFRCKPGNAVKLDMLVDLTRFERTQIESWLDRLVGILKRMTEQPDITLGQHLSDLSAEQQQQQAQQQQSLKASSLQKLKRIRRRAIAPQEDQS